MWEDLEPKKPLTLWVAQKVLCLSPGLIAEHRHELPKLIYQVYYGLEASDNKYITKWNAACADLIVEWVTPPVDDVSTIRIPREPYGDLAYWIAHDVLLLEDLELHALTGIPIDDIQHGGYHLIPVIKKCRKILSQIRLQSRVLQNWHKARHVMIRYFLDAEFHEL